MRCKTFALRSSFYETKRYFGYKAKCDIVRSSKFASISPDDRSYFRELLDDSGVVENEEEIAPYNTDWIGQYTGNSSLVLRPKTTVEVSSILQYCNKRKLAVVPQGGNTGLVGGSVPLFDEIVLSTSRLNTIRNFDVVSGVLECDGGCVLSNLDDFLAEQSIPHRMPLDLGAKGSCQIGGNVSTNAGGLRLLRYGSLHANILGLEVVLPCGEIVNAMSSLRKDSTGFDVKRLFIGAEGSLGVVTGVSILVPPRLSSVNTVFLGLNSYEDVLKTFQFAKSNLGEIISAVEFMDKTSVRLTCRMLELKCPLENDYDFYMLIETTGSNDCHDNEKLDNFLMNAMEKNIVVDGAVAQDKVQAANMWAVRDQIAVALTKAGMLYTYDVSMGLNHLYKLVEEVREKIERESDLNCHVDGFGHIGDGNLHLNVVDLDKKSNKASDNQKLISILEPFVFEFVAKHNGSVSAEHGLGQMKAQDIRYSKSENVIALMKQFKTLLDPNSIMNPYKVLPD